MGASGTPWMGHHDEMTPQTHIYALAEYLAARAGLDRIIDIGCGDVPDLVGAATRFRIVGYGDARALDTLKAAVPTGDLRPIDLEQGLPSLDESGLRSSVVVCTSALEHLRDPTPLARGLAAIARISPFVLISTPDRDRSQGNLVDGLPCDAGPLRGWNAAEFARFLVEHGFRPDALVGHTLAGDPASARTRTLVITGADAIPPLGGRTTVAAIIHAYNEADILPEVVQHLHDQGVRAHIFDDWSTDDTLGVANDLRRAGLCDVVLRGPAHDPNENDWALLLGHTERYAATLDADWVIHHDADEIRVAPWHDISLSEAFARVGGLGYNAVDFTVLDFRFLHSQQQARAPFQESLTHFEFGRLPAHLVQVKAWRNQGTPVSLVSSGGHDAQFDGRRVYPVKFWLKHYSLRSVEQANRKVFNERLPRSRRGRLERGWHSHYDGYAASGSIQGWDASTLIPWHHRHVGAEYLVERVSGIGLSTVGISTQQRQPLASQHVHQDAQLAAPGQAPVAAADTPGSFAAPTLTPDDVSMRRTVRRRLTDRWLRAGLPNPLFDAQWYLASYPDVPRGRLRAAWHWRRHGWREGRRPNPLFDTPWYLLTYPDVRACGIDPLRHYLCHGWTEGRDPSAHFDGSAYLDRYPDVRAAGIDPLMHYLRHGVSEGRIASPRPRSS